METPIEASHFDELCAAVICRDDALDDALDSEGGARPGWTRNGIRYVPYRYEYVLDRTRISVAQHLRARAGTLGR
jgi:hypothetical protein